MAYFWSVANFMKWFQMGDSFFRVAVADDGPGTVAVAAASAGALDDGDDSLSSLWSFPWTDGVLLSPISSSPSSRTWGSAPSDAIMWLSTRMGRPRAHQKMPSMTMSNISISSALVHFKHFSDDCCDKIIQLEHENKILASPALADDAKKETTQPE